VGDDQGLDRRWQRQRHPRPCTATTTSSLTSAIRATCRWLRVPRTATRRGYTRTRAARRPQPDGRGAYYYDAAYLMNVEDVTVKDCHIYNVASDGGGMTATLNDPRALFVVPDADIKVYNVDGFAATDVGWTAGPGSWASLMWTEPRNATISLSNVSCNISGTRTSGDYVGMTLAGSAVYNTVVNPTISAAIGAGSSHGILFRNNA